MAKAKRAKVKRSGRDLRLTVLSSLGVFAIIAFLAVMIGGPFKSSPSPKSSSDFGETRVGRIMLQRFGENCHQLLFDNDSGKTVPSPAPCEDRRIFDEDAETDGSFSTISKGFANRR
jgi:hypothetical protein